MMDTICVALEINPYHEATSDMLLALLSNAGFEGFEETGTGLLAYISEPLFRDISLVDLVNSGGFSSQVSWQVENVSPRNWNRVWEENYFKPLMIGDRVVVRSPFHDEFPASNIEIVIEPEMAFGTGNHETTSLMMESLLEIAVDGFNVLDMGCGTGILAILTAKLGALEVDAIDIDEWSFAATQKNCTMNQVSTVKAYLGDATLLGKKPYHLVLANIQRNVILADLPSFASVLPTGGLLLVSGFFISDMDDVTVRAFDCGFRLISSKERNQWVAMLLQKTGPS